MIQIIMKIKTRTDEYVRQVNLNIKQVSDEKSIMKEKYNDELF